MYQPGIKPKSMQVENGAVTPKFVTSFLSRDLTCQPGAYKLILDGEVMDGEANYTSVQPPLPPSEGVVPYGSSYPAAPPAVQAPAYLVAEGSYVCMNNNSRE